MFSKSNNLRRSLILSVACALLLACGNGGGSGGDNPRNKLTASDAGRFDYFGNAVAISDEVILIGAVLNDDAGADSGSAYVFRSDDDDWLEEQKLTASDASAYDNFGSAVAIAGDALVVGARFDDDDGANSGAAYVFRFDGTDWIEEQKLIASDAAASHEFGGAVAFTGDAIVVGAQGNGAAYVFRFDGTDWIEEEILTPAAPTTDFGTAVATSSDVIVVGSFGAAVVFRFDGADWIEEEELTGATEFGTAVAVSGDTIVVGASIDDDAVETDPGSAFIFEFDGMNWVETQELAASNATAGEGDVFGISVAVAGDIAVIGSRRNDDAAPSSGAAYVFSFDGVDWEEEQVLKAPDAAPLDIFGDSVAVSGDVIVVGATFDDGAGDDPDAGSNTGAAYVFEI